MLDLDALDAALVKATPRPWRIADNGIALSWNQMDGSGNPPQPGFRHIGLWNYRGGTTMCRDIRSASGDRVYSAACRTLDGDDDTDPVRVANDEVVISLVNAAPALIAELRDLRARLAPVPAPTPDAMGEAVELLREARLYVEAFDCEGMDYDEMSRVTIDLPKDGYLVQYAVTAAPDTLARLDAYLATPGSGS